MLRTILEAPFRYVFGHDVFISYARRDAIRYAPALANRIREQLPGVTFYIDQWASPTGRKLPAGLRRALRWSQRLVLVVTPSAEDSVPMRDEVRIFHESHPAEARFIVPIRVDEASVDWPELDGCAWQEEDSVAVREGLPSEKVIRRIVEAATFTTQQKRLQRSVFGAVALFLLLIAGAVAVVRTARASLIDLQKELADAQRNLTVARTQRKVAETKVAEARYRTARSIIQEWLARRAERDASARAAFAAEKAGRATRAADRQQAIAAATELANESFTAFGRGTKELPAAARHASAALRRFEMLGVRSPAADRAARQVLGTMGIVERRMDLSPTSSSSTGSRDGGIVAVRNHAQVDVADTVSGHIWALHDKTNYNIEHVVVSAGGDRIAARSTNRAKAGSFSQVLIWPTETLAPPVIVETSTTEPLFGLSDDGDRLAIWEGGSLMIVDAASGGRLHTLPLPDVGAQKFECRSLEFSTTGRYVALCGVIFDLDATPVRTLVIDRDQRPDVVDVVWTSYDYTAFVRSSAGLQAVRGKLEEWPPARVYWTIRESLLAISPDGEYIATTTSDADAIARVREAHNGREEYSVESGRVAAFSANGHHFAVGSWDGAARVYDWQGKLVAQIQHGENAIEYIGVNPSGLITTADRSSIKVWRTAPSHPAWAASYGSSIAAVAPDGSRFVTANTGDNRSVVRLLDSDGRLLRQKEVPYVASAVALVPDRALAIAGKDGLVRVYADLLAGDEPLVLRHATGVAALAVSRDGRHLAVAAGEEVFVWSDWHSTPTHVRLSHPASVTALGFSESGAALATGAADGFARVWNWRRPDDAPSRIARGAQGRAISRVSLLGPDGSDLAIVDDRETLIWSGDARPRRFGRFVRGIATDPTGTMLITADESVHVWREWRSEHPIEVARFETNWAHSDVYHVAVTSDARRLIAIGDHASMGVLWRPEDVRAALDERVRFDARDECHDAEHFQEGTFRWSPKATTSP